MGVTTRSQQHARTPWRPTTPGARRQDSAGIRSLLAATAAPVQLLALVLLGGFVLGDRHVPGAPHGVEAIVLIVPVWGVLVVPAVLGLWSGLRAVRAHERFGPAGLAANATVALAMTIVAGRLAA